MVINHSRQLLGHWWNFLGSVFCLLELQCTITYTNEMQPPVQIFRSWCTPYVSSTYVNNWLRLFATIILFSFIVCFRYCNTCLNVSLYYLVLLFAVVHRKNIAGSISGLTLFLPIVFLKLQSVGCLHLYFLLLWNSHKCSAKPSLQAMIWPHLSPL